ncbi:hypothetical protein HPB47_013179 [Ixodes persulcatus]|uniref:Uncharacterized protein n=1 Tax=Ixodes persulcatus TaxID=34615 RepID=A0AC60NRH7_IXOPE|nr:hypothetical protein HPB47_013179 [Ixodes persulcatus]
MDPSPSTRPDAMTSRIRRSRIRRSQQNIPRPYPQPPTFRRLSLKSPSPDRAVVWLVQRSVTLRKRPKFNVSIFILTLAVGSRPLFFSVCGFFFSVPWDPDHIAVPGASDFNMAASTSSAAPSKAQCFVINVPVDTPVDAIMDAFQHVVGDAGLQYLQHHGGARFMAAVNSMATAQRLVAQGHLLLGDVQVPLEPVGAHVVHVSVYRLPPYVSEDALVQVLGQYGKVKGLSHVTYRDRPDIRTGTRVVKLEMAKPVPNFIHI